MGHSSKNSKMTMRMNFTDLQMQKASCTDGLKLLSYELCLHILTELLLPTGCSQLVTEHSRDTKSGPFLIEGLLWATLTHALPLLNFLELC